MNDMDVIEYDDAGMSRRTLLGAGLLGATIIAGGAAKAGDGGGGFSAVHHGASPVGVPGDAISLSGDQVQRARRRRTEVASVRVVAHREPLSVIP